MNGTARNQAARMQSSNSGNVTPNSARRAARLDHFARADRKMQTERLRRAEDRLEMRAAQRGEFDA